MSPKRPPPPRPPLPVNMPPLKASAPQMITEPEEDRISSSPGPPSAVSLSITDDEKLRQQLPEIKISLNDTNDTSGQSTPGSDGEVSEESGDVSSTDFDEMEDSSSIVSSTSSANLFGAGLCPTCDDVLLHRTILQSGQPATSLVSCERCGLLSTTKYEDDTGTSKTRVDTLQMLQPADHVAWRRSAGAYWHHGIVEEVDIMTGQLLIVNYNGDRVKRDGHYASVRREWVKTNLRKKNLYRIDYLPGRCFPPDVVLHKAHGRLGEAKYNPFTQNCEHFARWCKSGLHRSVQVETLPQRLKEVPQRIRENVSKEKALKAATKAMDRSVDAGKRLLRKGAKGVFDRVGIVVAEKAPDVIDAVDRGMDRICSGLSKIEGTVTKQNTKKSSDAVQQNQIDSKFTN